MCKVVDIDDAGELRRQGVDPLQKFHRHQRRDAGDRSRQRVPTGTRWGFPYYQSSVGLNVWTKQRL